MWSANDEALINFGKHRGRRLSEVAAGEPDYLEWMMGNSRFDAETRDIAGKALDGDAGAGGFLIQRAAAGTANRHLAFGRSLRRPGIGFEANGHHRKRYLEEIADG